MEIKYIKGKNLSTKSLDDLVVTGFFEAGLDTGLKLRGFINKPFTITVKNKDREFTLDANVNQEIARPISFDMDSAMVKLDIRYEHEELIGDIMLGSLTINLY